MISRIRLRFFRYSIVAVPLLGILYTVFGTKIGLEGAVTCLQYFLPGRLTIIGLEGRLLGPIKANSIHYKDAQHLIRTNYFYIHWKKSPLLKGHFWVQKAQIKDLIVYTEPVQNNEPLHIPSFIKRIRLQEGQLTNCMFQMKDLTMQGQGVLGKNSDFNWTLQYKNALMFLHKNHTVKLQGTLTGDCSKRPELILKGGSTKHLIWAAPFLKGSLKERSIKLPPFQIKTQFDALRWLTELKFLRHDKPQATLALSILSPQRLLEDLTQTTKMAQCDLKLLIEDWSIVKNVASLSENLLLTDITGPLTLTCRLKGTGHQFQKWLADPKQQLLKQSKQEVTPVVSAEKQVQIQPQLSVVWQKAVAPNLGITLDEYRLNACLQGNKITWHAHATAPIESNKTLQSDGGKWQLSGTTQYIFSQASEGLSWWKHLSFKHDFRLTGTSIPWFTNTNYAFCAAPDVRIQANRNSMSLKGKINIPKAKFKFQDTDANQSLDKDVQFTDNPPVVSKVLPLATKIELYFGKEVYFEYEGVKSRLEGLVNLQKEYKEASLSAKGEIRFAEGYYCAGDQKLTISPDSKFIFKKSWQTPQMDITASQTVKIHPRKYILSKFPVHTLKLPLSTNGLLTNTGFEKPIQAQFGLHLSGDTENPELRLFANPPKWISQSREDISNMLTGQPVDRLSTASIPILLNAAAQLSIGYTGYTTTFSNFNKLLGLHFEIKTDETLEQTHLFIKKHITQKLSVSSQIGLKKSNAKFDYLLNNHMMIEGGICNLLGPGLDLVYQREYN